MPQKTRAELDSDEFIEEMKTPAWICLATRAPIGTPTLVGPGIGARDIEVRPKHRQMAVPGHPCDCTLGRAAQDDPRILQHIKPVFGENFALFPVKENGRIVFLKYDTRYKDTRAIILSLDVHRDAAAPAVVTLRPFTRSRTPTGIKESVGQGKPNKARGTRSPPYSTERVKQLRAMADANS